MEPIAPDHQAPGALNLHGAARYEGLDQLAVGGIGLGSADHGGGGLRRVGSLC